MWLDKGIDGHAHLEIKRTCKQTNDNEMRVDEVVEMLH